MYPQSIIVDGWMWQNSFLSIEQSSVDVQTVGLRPKPRGKQSLLKKKMKCGNENHQWSAWFYPESGGPGMSKLQYSINSQSSCLSHTLQSPVGQPRPCHCQAFVSIKVKVKMKQSKNML